MGNFGQSRNLAALGLVSVVLVLGLWVMTEPSDGVVGGFPAKSCLNTQPELSPTFEVCEEAEQRLRDWQKGTGMIVGAGADEIYQSLIDRVMAADDIYMAAYLTAIRAYSRLDVDGSESSALNDANGAVLMLAGEKLPGADAIRDLAYAVMAVLAQRGRGPASGPEPGLSQYKRIRGAVEANALSSPQAQFLAGATNRLMAEYALVSGLPETALAAADKASRAYENIGAERMASAVQMELAELARGGGEGASQGDPATALGFMNRAVQYACEGDDDPSYCTYVGGWAREFRQDLTGAGN